MGSRTVLATALAVALVPLSTAAQAPPPPVDREPGRQAAPPPVRQQEPPPGRQAPPPARPREAPPGDPLAAGAALGSGYCDWVEGVAGAESALLVAPELFVSAGVVNAGEATSDTPLLEPEARLTAGLRYDFIRLWRGLTIQDRAQAECRRFQARSALEAALRAGDEVGAAPAHAARAEVLARAAVEAETLLARLEGDVREALATADELSAARLRADGLRADARAAAVTRQRLEVLPHGEGATLAEVISVYRQADDEQERIEGKLRNLRAWSVGVRGGVDRVFRTDQDVPLFGLVEVSFNFGGLWVPGANRRAREGRSRWLQEDVTGTDRRMAELTAQLQLVRQGAAARLGEVQVLAQDLGAQLREVKTLGTSRVRRYESFLFFELARLHAEQAYLETHLGELDRILGSVGR